MKGDKKCGGCKAKRDAEKIINNLYGKNNNNEKKYNKRSKISGYILKVTFGIIGYALMYILLLPLTLFSLLFMTIKKKPIIIKRLKNE